MHALLEHDKSALAAPAEWSGAHELLSPTEALLRAFEFAPEAPSLDAAASPSVVPAALGAGAHAAVEGLQSRQGFRIGALNFMIGYADGSQLTELPAVHRLPNAPRWLLGMANLHGMMVPVFDLAVRFGVPRPATAKPLLLVLGHGPDAAGVTIDGVPERLRWKPEQVVDAATVPEALAAVVPRAVMHGERLWLDLDCAALLAALEQALEAAQ